MSEAEKKRYTFLFNQITDAVEMLDSLRDDCILMEAVPEYEPDAAEPGQGPQPCGDAAGSGEKEKQ